MTAAKIERTTLPGIGSLPLEQVPDLAEIQKNSFNWFVTEGLKEELLSFSPIRDYTGRLELYFLPEYSFDKPKYTVEEARLHDATYSKQLRIMLRLVNRDTGEIKEQEAYIGEIPWMTDRGTFIINGVERVVVSQLIRSAGVYFTAVPWRDRQLFGAKVIPNRGAGLEFETDIDGSIGVKIDRHRKVPVTDLLRVFGATEEQIRSMFAEVDTGSVRHVEATLKKDAAKDLDESSLEIYRRLRPGDPATVQTAKNLVDSVFQRADRYDISPVGRYKLNQRLGLDKKKASALLDLEDVSSIIREIIRLSNDPRAEADDIDHLGNRRLKAVGELLQGRAHLAVYDDRGLGILRAQGADGLLPFAGAAGDRHLAAVPALGGGDLGVRQGRAVADQPLPAAPPARAAALAPARGGDGRHRRQRGRSL